MSESTSTLYSLTIVRTKSVGPASYTLETAARIAGVHPEMLRYYCRLGLFGDRHKASDAVIIFDDNALYELRRFEHYRLTHGMSRKTLRMVCGLWREIERLETELRFLRRP